MFFFITSFPFQQQDISLLPPLVAFRFCFFSCSASFFRFILINNSFCSLVTTFCTVYFISLPFRLFPFFFYAISIRFAFLNYIIASVSFHFLSMSLLLFSLRRFIFANINKFLHPIPSYIISSLSEHPEIPGNTSADEFRAGHPFPGLSRPALSVKVGSNPALAYQETGLIVVSARNNRAPTTI